MKNNNVGLLGLDITVKSNDIVSVMGDLYAKTPEALKRLLKELESFGYKVENLRQAEYRKNDGVTVNQMEQDGWLLWFAKLPNLRRGKCKSCNSLIDVRGIQTHGHTCEVCGMVTYYDIIDGTTIRFEFINEYNRGYMLTPQLNMTAKRWDTEEGYLYLYYKFLENGGLSVVHGKRAEEYLAENKGMWEIVEENGDKLLKVKYPLVWNAQECAINPHDTCNHYWNHEIIKVWDGQEYSEYARLPIPETISIYESWHWAPLKKSPTIHCRILSAAHQTDDKGWHYQDGRSWFRAGHWQEMSKFIHHFTTLDGSAFDQAWPKFRADGPGGIDDIANFCHKDATVTDRPNMMNTLNAMFEGLNGNNLSDREVEAAIRGLEDPMFKKLSHG
jgi:hypothetical protein